MKRVSEGLAACILLTAMGAPLTAQMDQHTQALGAAIERAVSDLGAGGSPRSRILIDTARSAIDSRTATQLAHQLGVSLGRSEAHCRRFLVRGDGLGLRAPIGYEVRGVDAILTIGRSDFTRDSAHVWITTARGVGQYIGGPRSYIVRRDTGQWLAEPNIIVSPHGSCYPQMFTDPLVLAARTILADVSASGPLCYDATGFLLHERDSVATVLGAEVRGQWVPLIGGETPEPARDPCERAGVQWGSVVKFLEVDWQEEDVIHVTVEARVPVAQVARRRRYTLTQAGSEWIVTHQVDGDSHRTPDNEVMQQSRRPIRSTRAPEP